MTSRSVISPVANFNADGKAGQRGLYFFPWVAVSHAVSFSCCSPFPLCPAASPSGMYPRGRRDPQRPPCPLTPTLPGGTRGRRSFAGPVRCACVIQPLRGNKQPFPAGGKVPTTFNTPRHGVKAALTAGDVTDPFSPFYREQVALGQTQGVMQGRDAATGASSSRLNDAKPPRRAVSESFLCASVSPACKTLPGASLPTVCSKCSWPAAG